MKTKEQQDRDDRFIFDDHARIMGWRGEAFEAWLAEIPDESFRKILPPRFGYDRHYNEAIMRHLPVARAEHAAKKQR